MTHHVFYPFYFILSQNMNFRSALPTLLKMATSFAKLALRREVTEDDALIACYLYEEFIASLYGNSLLGLWELCSQTELNYDNSWQMRGFDVYNNAPHQWCSYFLRDPVGSTIPYYFGVNNINKEVFFTLL